MCEVSTEDTLDKIVDDNNEDDCQTQEVNVTKMTGDDKMNGKSDGLAEEMMEEIFFDQNKTSSGENSSDLSCNGVTNKNADLSLRVKSFKDWGYNTFMRTKQKMKEKLNQTSRTVDLDLEDRIEMIKLQQTQYKMLLNTNHHMVEQLKQNILTHQSSSRMFSDLAQTDKFLSETFHFQAQSELSVAEHFKILVDKLVLSTTTLETLVSKTFNDMLLGIYAFEISRVEYDAFRAEAVKLESQMQQKSIVNINDQTKVADMEKKLEVKKEKYETNKSNVLVKLNLFDDNKSRVIQREILNFKHAWFTLHSNCLELYNGNRAVLVVGAEDKPMST